MSEAQIGWGASFKLSNGTTLTELAEVVSFTLPNPQTEDVEVTHLKSPNKRREYIGGMIEDGEGTLVLNYVPGSPTDLLVRAAQNAGTSREFEALIPAGDGDFWEVTGNCIVKGVERGTIEPSGKMEVTVTVRYTGASTEASAA